MADEKEPTAAELDAQADKDFADGAEMETGNPIASEPLAANKDEPKAAADDKPGTVAVDDKPAEKFVQITEAQFAGLTKAAEKTAAFEQQFSKVFGTLGDVQKIVKSLQTGTPRGSKVEIPKEAFANLDKEFPELSKLIRDGVEQSLKGMTGTGSADAEIDPAKLRSLVSTEAVKLQVEALEDSHPDWRKIVGAIDVSKDERPDPNNQFRKWLGTKDAAYQAKINGTNSAAIIARAIDLFEKEKAAPPKAPAKPATDPKTQQRADRIKGAVQPKGDGRPPAPDEKDDEFEAGFKAG